MLRSLRLRLLSDICRAPENEGGASPTDDLELDPVDTETDPEDDEDVTDPAGEPEEGAAAAGGAQQREPDAEPRGRAGDTIRSLRARAQEAERRAQEADRRAEDNERRVRDFEARQRPAQQVDPQEEARLLEAMTPDQRADYKVNKALERFQQASAVQNFQTMDRIDTQAFQQECAANPLARKYAAEVDRELTKIRSEGGNVPRQAVLFYVLGRALVDKQRSTADKRASGAQDRIRRQTTRPTNSRGDVGGNRRGAASLEQRLENVPI
jgi:hypothetical protein